jgi:hypothetical protein
MPKKTLSLLFFFSLIIVPVASANIEISNKGISIHIVCTADIENTSINYTMQYKTILKNTTKFEINGNHPLPNIGDKAFINQTVIGLCKIYIRITCNNITVEQYGINFYLKYIPLRTIIT